MCCPLNKTAEALRHREDFFCRGTPVPNKSGLPRAHQFDALSFPLSYYVIKVFDKEKKEATFKVKSTKIFTRGRAVSATI